MGKMVIKDILPKMGLAGGSLIITGKRFQPWLMDQGTLHFPNSIAWIEGISETTLLTTVPPNSIAGDVYLDVDGQQSNRYHFIIPESFVDGLHIVDNPVVDNEGNIFTTYSGSRGENTEISVYKITPNGEKIAYLSNLANATSLLIGQDNSLYITSRLDGKIYKSYGAGSYEIFSQGLGIAFGLAQNSKGEIFVGDRNGSIFQISQDGQASFYASVPASYMAFHLAFDSEDNLYITNPIHMGENYIYKLNKETKQLEVFFSGFSLFHGFAFDSKNNLYIAETKRNESRLIKVKSGKIESTILSGTDFIGVAIDNNQNLIVATSTSLYKIDKGNY